MHYILLSFGIEICVQLKWLVLSMRTNPILSMRTSLIFNGRRIKLMITGMYKEDLGKAFLPQTMDDYWSAGRPGYSEKRKEKHKIELWPGCMAAGFAPGITIGKKYFEKRPYREKKWWWSLLYSAILRSWADLMRLHAILHEWIVFIARFGGFKNYFYIF